MSGFSVNIPCYSIVASLLLDRHFHSPVSLVQAAIGKLVGNHCDEGKVNTYEVCRVIAAYTPSGNFDLPNIAYRIWNAFKAILGCSDWQKAVNCSKKHLHATNVKPEEVAEILNTAFVENRRCINFKAFMFVELPKPCALIHRSDDPLLKKS